MRRAGFLIGALLAVLGAAPLLAQEAATVRGRVVDDATKQPIAGVMVTVAGRSALTGDDGTYVITGVRTGNHYVRARRIGYAPAASPITVVSNETVVTDFSLSGQAVGLAEMVVTGYGSQTAGDITGAVNQISSADFNVGNITTPQLLIENKIAGVQIVDNNDVGGGLSVRIRGATSVNASSEPLYVIDGMPVGIGNNAGGGLSAGRDPLNFLNPNDIESITVLKDASAAAIYGANAANGVVIITTKSKLAGANVGAAPTIEYSGSFSAASATKTENILSAAQFSQAVAQYDTAGLKYLGTASTDWFNKVLRTGYGQEHNLIISGAGSTSGYRISFGYYKQNGVVLPLSTERTSLGFNYDQHLLGDRLDVKTSIKGARSLDLFDPIGVMGAAAQMAPTQPVYDPASTTGYYDWPGNVLTATNNPVEGVNLAESRGTTFRTIGNVQADYRLPFVSGLKLSGNIGFDWTKVTSQYFAPSVLDAQQKNGNFGTFNRADNSELNTVGEIYLNYSAPLNVIPGNIDVTGGYSYTQSHAEYPSMNLTGLSSDLLGINGVPSATFTNTYMTVQDSRLISFFGRMNYNLSDRYLIAASLRHDGSSRFAPSNAWGNFPSVSFAWRISQEPFMRSFRALSDLKLRAAWATTGNQGFANYQQYTTFQVGDNQSTTQMGSQFVPTIRPSAVNPNIKWEATKSWNVGLDYGFNNQRITGSIDWYVKNTSDLIFSVPIPAGTNMSNYLTENIGTMRNSGIELALTAEVLRGGRDGLNWTVDFTGAQQSNKLTSISANGAYTIPWGPYILGGVGQQIQNLQAGSPINSFFVCKQVYLNGKPVEGQYYDLNGNQVTGCNLSNRRLYHDAAPKWMFGHTSNLTYRNFDLSFTLRAWLGNYVYNNVAAAEGYYDRMSEGTYPVNLDANVLETGFKTNGNKFSDYYIQDGSFLRMDNLTLGYSFKYGTSQMRLYVAVQNVFTITGYKGVDPTAGVNGIDNNLFPRSRTVTGGLSVRL
jgi:TonB-linked SusC/RagA family outer membrane protein